ncbi:LysR family transcriptional regulator [Pseudoalteromonas sp. SS15]|uniref:LysR family transcriptional regulator n=1 Tax=Pseudoalteromonas sp. SS15 TaxID=3139393 RepID=UPI003BAC2A7E
MRLRHIEIFHAIYTTGSITNAANLLHVSQPSVSKVLAHAELQLGFDLFHRVKGRLIPTEEAESLFGEVDKVYQQIHSIRNKAKNIKRAEYGNINLGISPALGFTVLPEALGRFTAQYPNISFNISTIHNDTVFQSLIEHTCDIAVLFSPKVFPGVTSLELAESEMVVVYPKAYFPETPKTLNIEQLAEYDFIDISESGPLGDLLWSRIVENSVELNCMIKVQTYFIATRLVAQGMGLCVVDKYTANAMLTTDTAMASFDPPLTFKVNALHLQNRQLSKSSEQFISELTLSLSGS